MDYAARKAWAFDSIYRKYIDPKYLRGNVEGGYDGRLKLLYEREKAQMERFVERKVEESKEVKLVSSGAFVAWDLQGRMKGCTFHTLD